MPRYRFREHPDCVVGAIDIEIPGGPGTMRIAAVGDDRADALGRAALIAERIASDPIMSALMPPQAQAAIKAAKGLAAAAKRGAPVIKAFWRKLRGPGKKRLASVLHKEAVIRERDAEREVAGWPFAHPVHVRHMARPEVGLRNPFRRKKKKRRVPPMQRPVEPPPSRRRAPEPEPEQDEHNEQAAPLPSDMPQSYGEQFDQAEGEE